MSQDNPHTKPITHPSLSVRKEEEAYELTISLSDKTPYKFGHFRIQYNHSGETILYEGTELSKHTYRLLIPLTNLLAHVTGPDKKETFSFYFSLSYSVKDEWIEQEFPLSLSLFDEFDAFGLHQTIHQKQVFIPYFTETQEIFSIALNVAVPSSQYFANHQLDLIKISKSEFAINGTLSLKAFTLNQVGVVLVGKRSGKEYLFPTNHMLNHQEKSTHLNHYHYSFSLDLQQLVHNMLIDNFDDEDFDLHLELYLNGLYSPVSIPLTTQGVTLPKTIYRDVVLSYGKSSFVLGLKFRGPQQAVSFAFTKYKKTIYTYYREIAPVSLVKSPINQRKNIWVIGENPMEARNNGWVFFCYLRKHHPEQVVYYVLDVNSADYQKAHAFDSEYVVPFKSKAYIDVFLAASVLLFTESPYDLYPSRSPLPMDFVLSKKILLQKNVLGLEDVTESLGYTTKNFRTDLVLTSSKTEERYLQQTLNYPEEIIRLTGLPRFDALLEENTFQTKASSIVIYPSDSVSGNYSQRDLVQATADTFLSLIQQPDFINLMEKYQLTTIVALPDNMKNYVGKFHQLNCTVVLQSNTDALSLLKSSKLFITDHHPLAFDASFIGVPVLFYQPELPFQKNRSAASLRPTYLNELPGEISTSQSSLLYLMQQLAMQDFKQSRKNRQKADALLHYPDTKSCERIFQSITNFLH